MESNPYLTNPDITDTEGNVYTLGNPALATREIAGMTDSDVRFRITSLRWINPDNKPLPYEEEGLF